MIAKNEKNGKVFEAVGVELGIKLSHDTHYDALNYEYSVVKGRELHRVDFQPTDHDYYQVTKLVEVYPFWPGMFRFLRNVVPLFPQVASVRHQSLSPLPLGLIPEELNKQIKAVLKSVL